MNMRRRDEPTVADEVLREVMSYSAELRAYRAEVAAWRAENAATIDRLDRFVTHLQGDMNAIVERLFAVELIDADGTTRREVMRTKTGRIISAEELDQLAAEAERGYDVGHLRSVPTATVSEWAKDATEE